MTSPLENLSGPGRSLKAEPADAREFPGLLRSGNARLQDSRNNALALESRFDLAYSAAHSFCLATLRWHGFRASNRYIVFQRLPATLEPGPEVWRVLAKCHHLRNLAAYEGDVNVDDRIVSDLIAAAGLVENRVGSLAPIVDQ